MGGSRKKQTVGYKYHLGAHLALCHGPIDKIRQIYVDDKLAWNGESTGGTITINEPKLFGGTSREGGIVGTVDFEQGGPAQGVNSYLSGKVGPFTPSFRGIAAAVLRQVYIGLSPYLKKWAFRAQRIHTRTAEGLAQWQDSLAELNDSSVGASWSAYQDVLGAAVILDIAYGNNVWVAGGNSGRVTRSADDGVAWDAYQDVLGSNQILDIAYGGGVWHACGTSGRITRSVNDGVTWEAYQTINTGITLIDIAYGNNVWHAASESGGLISRSTNNGVTWETPQTILGASNITDVEYNSGVWIAGGTSGRITRSTDNGVTWEAYQTILGGTVQISDIEYGNGVWVASGASGRITRSTDNGVTWEAYQTILGGVQINKISYGNSTWVAAGNSGRVSISTDNGVTWQAYQTINGGEHLNAISYGNGTWVAGGALGRASALDSIESTRIDMNAVHIIRECLTDPDWGMGYPEADVDETSFAAAAQTLFNEDLGLSITWATETTIESFVSEVIRHIDAALYVDRVDGKFHIKLIRNDYDVGTIPELNETNVLRIEGFNRPVFDDLINTVIVKYYDRERRTNSSVSLNNIALVQTQCRIISETLNFNGVCYNELAQRICLRELKVLSHPLATCVVYANREASTLNPGDVFKLNHSDVSATPIVMRVSKIAYGDGKSTRVKIECVEDVFSLSSNALIGIPVSEWNDPLQPPDAATNRVVAEIPYYELVQSLGQTNADNQLTLNEFAGFAFAGAANPGSAINATLSVDSGSGYEDLAVIDFCPFAQLSASVGKTDTNFLITGGIDLSDVVLGTFAQIDNELIRIDTITDTTLTVGRGVLDTVPTTHDINAKIFFWDDYSEGGDQTEYGSGTTINLKIRPVNGSGEVELVQATADQITFAQRALRPYPPGLFRVNGSVYPAEVVGQDAAISWAHRDRLQQTSGTIEDQESGNIGPEAGTTYTATLYNNIGGATLEQTTGITGTSKNFATLAGYFNLRAEVFSVRDSLNNWQTHSHVFDYYNHILITESGDYLITESGDYLIEE